MTRAPVAVRAAGSAAPLRRALRLLVTRLLIVVAGPLLRAAVRIEVEGRLPPGGAVLASNHPNYLDGPLIMALDDRVRAVAKPQASPLVRSALWAAGSLLTGGGSRGPALAHLRGGGLLWLAPEGRMTGATIGPLRTGAVRLAVDAGVPLVPVGIRYLDADGAPVPPGPIGTVGPRLHRWRPWRRPRVQVRVGRPLHTGREVHVAQLRRALWLWIADLSGVPAAPRRRAARADS